MDAAAPAAQSGERAFRGAKQSADLSDTKSLAMAREAVKDEVDKVTSRKEGGATKQIDGKIFIQKGKVWTDAAHNDTLRVVDVAPYSEAWFALARALPEIVPGFSAGDEVLVAGRRLSVRVIATGTTKWTPGQLERVVRDFRGQ
jgi:hypothetical protein